MLSGASRVQARAMERSRSFIRAVLLSRFCSSSPSHPRNYVNGCTEGPRGAIDTANGVLGVSLRKVSAAHGIAYTRARESASTRNGRNARANRSGVT